MKMRYNEFLQKYDLTNDKDADFLYYYSKRGKDTSDCLGAIKKLSQLQKKGC